MKNKDFFSLKTPYADEMNRDIPWEDYPRPSLVRDSYMSLNGRWNFSVCLPDESPDYSDSILVPFPPESALSEYEKEVPKGHVMHYRRSFKLPEGFNIGRVLLHFGAIDTTAEVYLNGRAVGSHAGGYLPFYFDITEYISDGENLLTIRVVDDLSGDYPYGKQCRRRGGMWYTPVSGIWQSVWLESVPNIYVERLQITPTVKDVKIQVIGGEREKRVVLDSGEAFEFSGDEITLSPEKIELWTPENPKLYGFRLECGDDVVRSYFALREIAVREVRGVPRITLNGEAYLFNGLLDQGYYPDGIFLPATARGYAEDIRISKSLGFNMLRKHIKVEPEIFYYLCDKMGMAVFQDMVNNSGYSFIFDTALPTVGMKKFPDSILHTNKRSREIFIRHMRDTIEHLYSFPSVVYYTIFNEGWGQFRADDMYRLAKSLDPTRVIDATSGWFIQSESDVDSHHVYFKPIRIKKTSRRPIVISEFGGYSHRVAGHLFGKDNYGYRLFKSLDEFEDAFIKLYTTEVEPTIELGVSALVYTQVSDVEDETNGILTYDRKVLKLSKDRILPIMERIKAKIR